MLKTQLKLKARSIYDAELEKAGELAKDKTTVEEIFESVQPVLGRYLQAYYKVEGDVSFVSGNVPGVVLATIKIVEVDDE